MFLPVGLSQPLPSVEVEVLPGAVVDAYHVLDDVALVLAAVRAVGAAEAWFVAALELHVAVKVPRVLVRLAAAWTVVTRRL